MFIRKLAFRSTIFSVFIFIIISVPGYSQSTNLEAYQFISPKLGSSLHLPETNIIIRQGEVIDNSTLENNMITVLGSQSGIHSGELILSTDFKTLIFKPYVAFSLGEIVSVNLTEANNTTSSNILQPLEFSFRIAESICKEYPQSNNVLKNNKDSIKKVNKTEINNSKINFNVSLPEDFPPFEVTILNNPSDKYIFISPYILASPLIGYTMILNNDAIPIYYQRTLSAKLDFKLQFNGLITYWDDIPQKFFMIDSSYAVVDSFECGNGYVNDNHELLVFEDGHSFLLATDPQYVRMDTVVQGGDSSAIVRGLIIQELDANKNVIFQWRSWDHFQITDATEDIDLTAHNIDYVHGNAIELDSDDNLLLSSRYLDEITKIDRQTGEIIWRLGGLHSRNNQFQFVGDPITFSHQHDIRRLPNGNITLFDNGNLHFPQVSRSLEYQLDEANKIAVLVWKYNNDPTTYARAMASSRRLENHNTLIGWGYHLDNRAVSEIKPDGTIALEWLLPDTILNYRAFKFNWRTNYFRLNPDSIFFESVAVGDSAIIPVAIENNSSLPIEINSFYNKDSIYSVADSLPISIPPSQTVEFNVKFKPLEDGYFKDYLHIRSDTDTSRIAQVLVLGGRTDTTFSSVENEIVAGKFKLEQNFPNPFNPSTIIRFSIPEFQFTTLKVYDVLGNEVTTIFNQELPAGSYERKFDGSQFSSGIYFYRIQSGKYSDIKKLILLK